MLCGQQTWQFPTRPRVLGTGTIVGEKEGQGPLGDRFDLVVTDPYVGQDSFEKAERKLMEKAQETAVQKAGLTIESISMVISGDLLAQNISSHFAARTQGRPLFNVFSACATSMQAVAMGAQLVDTGYASNVLAAVSSHNSSAERAFRYPTEYGAQKPPTAHCTVTGAGALVVGKGNTGPIITHATLGKVIDLGIDNPWEMGAAMAPAAADTLARHFLDTGRKPEDYDLIATGDLARVGHPIARHLLLELGYDLGERFTDCGILMYDKTQSEVFSGGSGPACAACVTFGHLLLGLTEKCYRRILVVATGALLSPISSQQKDTIPCIAHAVAFERDGE